MNIINKIVKKQQQKNKQNINKKWLSDLKIKNTGGIAYISQMPNPPVPDE